MAQYIEVDGKQKVQLDNGTIVDVMVVLALDGGFDIKLLTEQLDLLRSPNLPSSYPLPASQVADLKAVSLANFPEDFAISNFPDSFEVENMPSTFPLSPTQAQNLLNIANALDALTKGGGDLTAQTLRVTLAADQNAPVVIKNLSTAPVPTTVQNTTPILVQVETGNIVRVAPRKSTTVVRGSITAGTTVQTLASANANRTSCTIYNNGSAPLFIAHGANASTSSFTAKVFPDGYYVVPETDVELVITGIWSGSGGNAMVTEGIFTA